MRLLSHRPFLKVSATAILAIGMTATSGALAAGPALADVQPQLQTISFTSPGTSTWTVPPAITSVHVVLEGASGGSGHGGRGGRTSYDLPVTPGDTLQVNVGGQGGAGNGGYNCDRIGGGVNGGGYGWDGGSGGGGATDIRTGSYGLADRILVAGGGGGGTDIISDLYTRSGGDGGSPASAGADGLYDDYTGGQGFAGQQATQTAGGAAGRGDNNPGTYGFIESPAAGALGVGGHGGCSYSTNDGTGGGGGYYGGGAGGAGYGGGAGTGGGGTSYGPASATFDSGINAGDGSAVITYTPPAVGLATYLKLTPATVTTSPGDSHSYSAEAYDVYNDDLGDVTVAATFMIGGGSCTTNTCSSLAAGDHRVTASIDGASGTATQTTRGTSILTLDGVPVSTAPGVPHSITVTALDSKGVVATNDTSKLSLTSTDGNAVLPSGVALVDGVATFPVTFANAGDQKFTVSEPGDVSVTSDAVAVSGAVSFAVSGYPSATTADDMHTFTVTALDADGAVVTDYAGSVHFTSTDGQATLPVDTTLADGSGTFSAAFGSAGSQTITATGVKDGDLTGSQSGIAVTAAAIHALVETGLPSGTVAGTPLAFSVQGVDDHGNPVTNLTGKVTLTSTDPNATLPTTDAASTDGADAGTASATATLTSAGSQTITFTSVDDPTLTGSFTLYVQAAAYDHLTATLTGDSTAGTARFLQVQQVDSYGNATVNFSNPFQPLYVTTSDGNATLPSYQQQLIFGQAYIPITLVTAGNQTVTASTCPVDDPFFCTVILQGSSATATTDVVPGAAQSLTLTGSTSAATAGGSRSVTVTASDAFGNVTTASDALAFSSTDPRAALPTGALSAGVFTGNVGLSTAGSQSIQVSSVTDAGLTATLGPIVISAGPAAKISLGEGYPNGSTAGDGIHLISASITDSYGNATPDYSGTMTVTSSDGKAILPVPVDIRGGSGAIPIELRTAGLDTVTVRDSSTHNLSTPALTGSTIVRIVPAAAERFVLAPVTRALVHKTQKVSATAVDEFGNTATGFTGSVRMFRSGRAVSGAHALVAGTQVFSVAWTKTGTATLKAVDKSQPGIRGSLVEKVHRK